MQLLKLHRLLSTFSLAAGTLLLLAGCTGGTESTYMLIIDTDNAAERTELVAASQRIVERRLEAMGEKTGGITIDVKDRQIQMHIPVANDTVASVLKDQLVEPFTLRIMNQVDDGKGDITVEGHGSFKETGLQEEHLRWVDASKDAKDATKGMIDLNFTEEGRTLMGDVFKKNKGKFIGLFVRKHLVSKLLVESTEVKDSILITDIPSLILAEIFADDVNVGLHVKFIPVAS